MGMYVYKMFNKGLICRGYKFKEGLNECDHATCVREGFHAAENPLDCLSYYPDFDNSECWLCYADGDIHEDGTDSKISCTCLEILRRLEKHEFVVEAVTYMLEHPKRPHNSLIKRDEAETEKQNAQQDVKSAEVRLQNRQLEIDALRIEVAELKEAPKQVEPAVEKVYEPSKKQIKEIRDKAFEEAEKRHKSETDKLTADLAEKDKLHAKAIEELQEENKRQIRQLVQRSDPHSARVSYCMEAINRALNDLNTEIKAMEEETPGSGTKMRMRCESTLLSMLNRLGWQV